MSLTPHHTRYAISTLVRLRAYVHNIARPSMALRNEMKTSFIVREREREGGRRCSIMTYRHLLCTAKSAGLDTEFRRTRAYCGNILWTARKKKKPTVAVRKELKCNWELNQVVKHHVKLNYWNVNKRRKWSTCELNWYWTWRWWWKTPNWGHTRTVRAECEIVNHEIISIRAGNFDNLLLEFTVFSDWK